MHGFLSNPPSRRKLLSVAVLLLAANAAAAGTPPDTTPVVSQGYSWTIPQNTFDTQNGYTPGSQAVFTGINDAGTITGSFIYNTQDSTISGLTRNRTYGFEGAAKVQVETNTGTALIGPGFIGSPFYGTNAVTGINNNGYATYSGASESLLSGPGGNFSSGTTVINDTNTLPGGYGTDSQSFALGLDNSLVVGANLVQGGSLTTDGFIYNMSGAAIAGIANGGYADFSYGGAVTGALTDTDFTGVQTSTANGDVYVSGYFGDDNGVHGLIYNLTTNTWSEVSDPNATGGTYVTGLNANGEAVGFYYNDTGYHGFTYDYLTNTFITAQLDEPNAALGYTVISGVNAAGTLVGTYQDGNGNYVGFQASSVSAVPLPGGFWLMSSVLAAFGLARKSGRRI